MIFSLLLAVSLRGAPAAAPLSFYIENPIRIPGQSLVIRARGWQAGMTHKAKAFKQESAFYPLSAAAEAFAILAVPLEAKLGKQPATVAGQELGFEIKPRDLKEEVIQLPKKASKAAESLADEKDILQDAMLLCEGAPLWQGKFELPARGRLSTPFAAARLYLPAGYRWKHKGLDLAMPTGTPLRAANRGVVVLAREFKAYGSVVLVRHGCGLASTCMHMSRILVKEGQKVSKGTLLGYSGASGISTGPHLHFQLNLRSHPLDPGEWLGHRDQAHSKALAETGPALP